MNDSESKGFNKTESIPGVSDDVLEMFAFVSIVLIPILALPGVVLNVINVIVFTRMGMTDTTTISLVALAVADLGSQVTMLGFSITSNPLTVAAVRSRETLFAIEYDLIGAPHNMFSRISGLLNGLISFERFICVAWPLHVRTLVTRRRTSLAVVGIYILMFAGFVPAFMGYPLGMKYDPELNITFLAVIYGANTVALETISIDLSVTVQMASFAVVTGSTLFLAKSLRHAAQWRAAVAGPVSKATRRDKKLIKMVVMISTVFIACSMPSVVNLGLLCFNPDFRFNGVKFNLMKTTLIACFELQLVSTSVNIFIYLAMSSKFKAYFFDMFGVVSTQKEMQNEKKVN